MQDIENLCAVEDEGVEGVICGRAIYWRPRLCRRPGARRCAERLNVDRFSAAGQRRPPVFTASTVCTRASQ